MLLDYLGQPIAYLQLLNLLKIQAHGAPAGNIRLLNRLNLTVTYSQTDLSGLKAMLNQGQPPIIFVRTGELPYWSFNHCQFYKT
jgi:hypothetical protein